MCLALYGGELENEVDEEEEEEEGEEGEEEEQLELHRLPDLLYRKAPRLLQYTAALHSLVGEEDLGIQKEHRGEFGLDSSIGKIKSEVTNECMLCHSFHIKP